MKKLLIAVLVVGIVLGFSIGARATTPYDEELSVYASLRLTSGLLSLSRIGGPVHAIWDLPAPVSRGRYFTRNNVIELRMDSSVKWDLYADVDLNVVPCGTPGDIQGDFQDAFQLLGTKSKNSGAFSLDHSWWCYQHGVVFAHRYNAAHQNDMRMYTSYRWDTDYIGQHGIPDPGTYRYRIKFTITAV